MKPTILAPNTVGRHNGAPVASRDRILRGNTYRDASTVCLIPTRGLIHARVVQAWWGMMTPMNQRFSRLFAWGMEVAHAYEEMVANVLAHPDLGTWKYVLTLEEDNLPPPDGLLKLIEAIEGGVDGQKYDAVGGLYWTKGEGGQPMCYGQPDVLPLNFIPWLPVPGTVARCNGLGMGFTLFRMAMFKGLPRPWFRTVQEYAPGVGGRAYTQDLWFFEQAGRAGHRFACDARVLVGHYNQSEDVVW
mgnify:CR=1 FL=1